MAIRIPAVDNTYIESPAAFTHTAGALWVGMLKVVTDQDANQAFAAIRTAAYDTRHEMWVQADGTLKASSNWGAVESAVLGTAVGSGWMWAAARLWRNGSNQPRITWYVKTHPAGPVTTAELSDGGIEATAGSPRTYLFAVGMGVLPWVRHGGIDVAYQKVFSGSFTDDDVIAEMNAFAMVRSGGRHSYLTGIGKANLAAALLDESGNSNNWTAIGTPTVNDAANPAPFGGTPPTITIATNTVAGQTISGAGTLQTSAGTPTVQVQLLAGATGVAQGPIAATVVGNNWSASFAGVPAGSYTLRATITNVGGSATATAASAIEIVGLSGTGILPDAYSAGAISMTPEAASLTVSGTTVLTIVDQSGLPLDGVVVTSSATGVATVTSPSNAQGQVTVLGVSSGSATISAAFTDPVAGLLSDSSAISVGLATPAAPTGLTATALGPGSVRLAWTDNSANELGFIVERALVTAGTPGAFTSILTPGAGVVTVDDGTVVAGTTYAYRVRATNGSGASAPSNVASVAVPAAPDTTPPLVALSVSTTSVTVANATLLLTAQASDNVGVTEVRFFRNGAQIGAPLTAPNAGASYQIALSYASSADNGAFAFTARAFDAAGNSAISSAINVTVAIPSAVSAPAAPSALAISEVTQTSMRLTWQDNATDETAMLIERAIGASGAWEQVQSLPAGATTWAATTLLANTQYRWRVRAQGAQAASGYTNEASATTLAPDATGLSGLTVSVTTLSGVPGSTASVTYTAVNGNGSTRPGVTITPSVSIPGVASVAPANGVTDGDGKATFAVTFGATVAQAQLQVSATDGQASVSPASAPTVQVFTLPSITTALVREFQQEQMDPKYRDEVTPIVWDYSPFLGRGELPVAIVSRESVPTSSPDRDPAAAAMLFGDGVIVGDRVLQWVRDGVPGVSYFLRCRVRTSIGRVVVAEVRLRIYRAPGARVASSSPVVD